jgi:hypothetical protein
MYSNKNRNSRASIYDFCGVDDSAYLMMLEEAAKVRKRRELFESNEKSKLQEITENAWDSKGQWMDGWGEGGRGDGEREKQILTEFEVSMYCLCT